METSEILKMVENTFYNRFFIIDVIVSDYDSTIRSMIKHPYKGARGQVLKSSKGKLDEEIPVPYFLADLSHCVKVVAKHISSIINDGKAQRYGRTKVYDLQLKKYWGCMIKNYMKKIEDLSEGTKVPLQHMFNNHDNCSTEWCFKTRAP